MYFASNVFLFTTVLTVAMKAGVYDQCTTLVYAV